MHTLGIDPTTNVQLPAKTSTTAPPAVIAPLTDRHPGLVKRVNHMVQRIELAIQSHHQLTESWHTMTEWIGQLKQSLENYAVLSGDRHMLQARLELIKVGAIEKLIIR